MIKLKSNNPLKHRSLKKDYGVQHTTIGSVPSSHEMTSVAKVIVTAENIGQFQDAHIGDIWHEVHNVPLIALNGTHNGKIAEIHKGEVLLTSVETDPEVPPGDDQEQPLIPEALNIPIGGKVARYKLVEVIEVEVLEDA